MMVPFLLTLIMLAGASWSDLRTRRVPNLYWYPWIAVAALLWLGPGQDALLRAAGAAAMTVAVYLMWRLGMFGGADAKALMLFAWLWPGVPDLLGARTLPVLDTLVNATIVALALPVLFLAVNILRGDFSFPAALLGTRIPLQHAMRRHVWPMQRVDLVHDEGALETPVAPPAAPPVAPPVEPPSPAAPTHDPTGAGGPDAGSGDTPGPDAPSAGADAPAGRQQAATHPTAADLDSPPLSTPPRARHPPRPGDIIEPPPPGPTPHALRWRYWQRPGEDLEHTYRTLHAAGIERVWVTPKIPFMVPLAVATVATWLWGNAVLRLLSPG